MAIDSSVLLMVQTYSRDRENRIYGTGKVIGKLLKFKGFKAVDLAFKRGDELVWSKYSCSFPMVIFQ
jgi:hypothetical protein